MKQKVLITGATGTVGQAILRYLINHTQEIFKSTRRPPGPGERYFDYDDLKDCASSLVDIDILFLLRPPHIANVKKHFAPLIEMCRKHKVQHIIFLSVQGVEKSRVIPHHKIEKLIRGSGLPFTFVQPSYFMQNLTTTLATDISRGRIFLPAGNAPFLWIDADDIGKAVASIIRDPVPHRNSSYVLTGSEYFTFAQVAARISEISGRNIRYESPPLLPFLVNKMRDGLNFNYVMVLIMLHYLARFQDVPPMSDDLVNLTREPPQTLEAFLLREFGRR